MKITWGRSWKKYHHHHMHARLGTRVTENYHQVGVGDFDNDAPWFSEGNDVTPDLDPTKVLLPTLPQSQPSDNRCYIGFRYNAHGKKLCAGWRGSDDATDSFIGYPTDECAIETPAVHLKRNVYNAYVEKCAGQYVPSEEINEP
jgi:hypothetical protein